jgi:hypothetical protein
MNGWARNHTEREWNGGYRLEPHQTDLHGGYWQPNRARYGDTEAKLLNRVAVLDALNLPPRDPRFWNPRREAGWNNDNPLWGNYVSAAAIPTNMRALPSVTVPLSHTPARLTASLTLTNHACPPCRACAPAAQIPEYGIGDGVECVGQMEEHVRRPTLSAQRGPRSSDFVQARSRLGRRTTPLIAYNSIGWNRRHYEPIPDVARPQSKGVHGWTSTVRSVAGSRSGHSTPGTLSPSRSHESLMNGLGPGGGGHPRALAHLAPENGPMHLDAYAQVGNEELLGTTNSYCSSTPASPFFWSSLLCGFPLALPH